MQTAIDYAPPARNRPLMPVLLAAPAVLTLVLGVAILFGAVNESYSDARHRAALILDAAFPPPPPGSWRDVLPTPTVGQTLRQFPAVLAANALIYVAITYSAAAFVLWRLRKPILAGSVRSLLAACALFGAAYVPLATVITLTLIEGRWIVPTFEIAIAFALFHLIATYLLCRLQQSRVTAS